MAWEGLTIVTGTELWSLFCSRAGAESTPLAHISPGVPAHGGSIGSGPLTT